MCGIAGCVSFGVETVSEKTIGRMTDTLAHRGPDGRGVWIAPNVGLGHRRLSIIDLSPEASQPMHSYDNRLHIVFNGEIYNYKELAREVEASGKRMRTHSDTEVILHLYALHGTKTFTMLRGMFAFGLWDSTKKELLLVRDRLGIKPLYYLSGSGGILFASEIKAIAMVHPCLTFDKGTFWRFLRTATSQGADTIFAEVKRLEPGTFLTFSSEGTASRRYWDLQTCFEQPVRHVENEDDEVNRFRETLAESIRYHLVADVPVGGFLSGGLDSSTVIGYMRYAEPQSDINTYSIVFPGMPEHDEGRYAALASRHLGTTHTAIAFKPDFIGDIDSLAWSCDEPFGILSSYALYSLSRETSRKTKVVVTGDGGDELLAGYQGYLKSTRGYPLPLRAGLRVGGELLRMLSPITPILRDEATSAWIKALRKTGTDGFRFSEQTAYSGALDYTLLNDAYVSEAWTSWRRNTGAMYYDALSGDTDLRKKLFSSMKARLVDEMLTKVDRMTMAHSLEARVPLLDHVLVEYATTLPDNLKLRHNGTTSEGKYILKRAAGTVLPQELIHRPKHGFDIPIHSWLIDEALTIARELVMDGFLVREHIIDRNRVLKMFDGYNMNNVTNAQTIVNLFILEQWFLVYTDRIPGFRLGV